MQSGAMVMMVFVAGLIFWRRMKAASRPIRGKGYRLLLPLLFLSFGLLGLFNPQLVLSTKEVILSLLCGAVLSVPMIMTTNYERRDDGFIYAKRSKAFMVVLVALIALRLALRSYLSGLDPAELGMLFYLIAVGYIVPWRVASYLKYRKLALAK
ncbi:Membrane protein CcdC involved in cytochrome C biogenesis [Paenibacillus sp. UNCCL117]|uniref:cytochrome c biogenesis protein CcdC n=1 Tax=unclassified Paenibacillus TaxID=185978 RepID=UPI000885FF78|nr:MULTISPECIES: cytochrome c biogenesis protein CcdC [unclassified Paenibacillus]SDD77952.1 Membrane protein CcdC involved in cytochrome C biogenesis [Paenibacillus sp. cl123]SFW52857.1 Membrane protein CcdC involved in cytochrome C biogenesis [Paenibacillus sp. UNCCL117]